MSEDPALLAKLEHFDAHAMYAIDDLIFLLVRERARLIGRARERHIWGHHEYGDANMREWSDTQLAAERDDEVCDWIVYRCEELRRRNLKEQEQREYQTQ